MAEFQWDFGPRKLNKKLALNEGVQDALERYARHAYSRAKTDLAVNHRDKGDSFVFLLGPPYWAGTVDWHVGIDDTRGQAAAGGIARTTGVLHRAFSLAAPERKSVIANKGRKGSR